MSRFNLTWRFAIAVGAAILTGIAIMALLTWQLHATSVTYDTMLSQREVQHQDRARVVQLTFKKQVQEWKNLLLRGYKFEDFQKSEKAFKAEEADTRRLALALLEDVKDPEANKAIRAFITAHETMGQSYDAAIKVFSKSNGQDFAAADALVKGQDRGPTDALDALATRLRVVLEEMRQAEAANVSRSILRSVIIGGVAFTVIVVLLVFLVRATRKEMVEVTDQLSSTAAGTAAASSQVSTSAQSLSQGATEQAASLEETSASMEEMASMTRRNAEHSETAAGLMTSVDSQVAASNAALRDMVTAMGAIQESSQQVARIIKTIDEIAFQTNILALNAAVEAARAGEAGMGFAVVADEVRNLAQRSAQAARDTAALIEESIGKAQDGGQRVDQVGQAINAITESIGKVKGLVDEVSVASRQQAQGIDQVSQAIAQMEKVTQTTAATAEESAAASEELSSQAETAMHAVRQLETLVGAASSGATTPTAQAPAARPRATIVTMPRPRVPATTYESAEEFLPLENTGTFGKF